MSKAVLLSIAPRWCELIASGKKTVEVRKTRPKIETPFKCYIYMTKDIRFNTFHVFNAGKVIGEFVCDSVGEAWLQKYHGLHGWLTSWGKEQDCLTGQEMSEYAGKRDALFGWHISDLVIYDKPKELREFSNGKSVFTIGKNGVLKYTGMTRPPQSWCYVEEVADDA